MKNTQSTFRLILISGFLLIIGILFSPGSVSAATITVATGDDELTANSNCSFSEAITNINTHSNAVYTECPAGDGLNDTINIPSGTIKLVGHTILSQPVKIHGAGVGQTTIDGNSLWRPFNFNSGVLGDSEIFDLKIVGFMNFGIGNEGANLAVERVEIDGTRAAYGADGNDTMVGMSLFGDGNTISLSDTYIHSISSGADAVTTAGIIFGANSGGVTERIARVTIADIFSESSSAMGILHIVGWFNEYASGSFDSIISNATLTNIHATGNGQSANAVGILFSSAVNGGDDLSNIVLSNNTITDINQEATTAGAAAQFAAASLGNGDESTYNVTHNNQLLSAGDGDEGNCSAADITSAFEGLGTVNLNFISGGGNISDDTSCSSMFTEGNDQNNVTNLASFLSPLTNSGGYVSTIPLLAGSTAIDGGNAVSGINTDARGVTRPQGAAYDSGAYEYVPPSTASNESTDSLAGTGVSVKIFALLAVALIGISGGFAIKRVAN